VDTPLFRDSPKAMDHIDTTKDFLLPPEEVVKAMIALVADAKYRAGTVLEVNDIDGWREVQLLNDPGPQGQSKNPRQKALDAIITVKNALEDDAKGYQKSSKL
jgi:3-hydroxybutyrate dehydrogenase